MKTKQDIMKESFELLKEKGYDNVSIEEICKVCQINKTIFYSLIESKENILSFHYDQVYQQLKQSIETREKNMDLLWTLLTFPIQENMKLGPELYSQYIIRHFHGQTLTTLLKEPLQVIGIEIIEKAQKEGQIKNQSNPAHLYNACRNLSGSYAIRWCINKGNFDLIESYKQALNHILNLQ